MKQISKWSLSILFIIMFSTAFWGIQVNAVEDIESIGISQSEQANAGQVYINEPLDNAVPVIYSYEIESEDGNGKIIPGEEFVLKIKVYNSAVVSKLGNIRIEVTQADGLIYPQYGRTNSVYIGYLEPLAYAEGSIKLIASKSIVNEQVGIFLNISYSDNYSTNVSQQLDAILPVSSSGKLRINNVDISSNMYVGTNNRFSITYQNNGLSNVNNVVLHLKGDYIDEQEISLGNIGSGSSITSDFYVDIKKAGNQIITMFFTYVDNDGLQHETNSQDYNVLVNDYADADDESEAYRTQNYNINRTNFYITVFIAVISFMLVMGYASVVLLKHKHDFELIKDKKK